MEICMKNCLLIHSDQHDVPILLSNVSRFSRHGWESSFPLPSRPRGCFEQAGLSNLLYPMQKIGGWWKDNMGLPAKVRCWKICNVDTTIKKEPGTLPQWWFGIVFTEIIWINIKIQIVGVLFNALKWWGTVDGHDRSWPLLKSWYSIVTSIMCPL